MNFLTNHYLQEISQIYLKFEHINNANTHHFQIRATKIWTIQHRTIIFNFFNEQKLEHINMEQKKASTLFQLKFEHINMEQKKLLLFS